MYYLSVDKVVSLMKLSGFSFLFDFINWIRLQHVLYGIWIFLAQNYYLHSTVMAHRRANIGHGEYMCIWGFDEKAVHVSLLCDVTCLLGLSHSENNLSLNVFRYVANPIGEVLHLVISMVKNVVGLSV